MSNSKFWDGILAQTPQYAISEEVKVAYFVAIAHTDADLEPDRQAKVTSACKLASEQNDNRITVVPLIIDGRRKESASKKKVPR